MLTPDDVAAVPLFAALPAAELERLARTSADLHLAPGEFAVPEGGERALYAVLGGRVGRDPYLLETSVPDVFACGDVRLSPVKRVAAAVGEGSMAIALVLQFLANEGRGPIKAEERASGAAEGPVVR